MRDRIRPSLTILPLLIAALLLATCSGGEEPSPGGGKSKTAIAAWLARTAVGATEAAETTDEAEAGAPSGTAGETAVATAPGDSAAPDAAPDADPDLTPPAAIDDPDPDAAPAPTPPPRTAPTGATGTPGSDEGEAAAADPDPPTTNPAADGADRVDLPQTATTPGDPVPATEAAEIVPSALDVEQISRSIVRVETVATRPGGDAVFAFGSGTIVDGSGLILTNFHVIDPAIGHDRVLVGLTTALDTAPSQRFLADVLIADPALDLAVLQIVAGADGAPIDIAALGLPALELGDSDRVRVLDPVMAFGYPDIGDETLTVTAGSISGFLSQIGIEERRAWFKTDTTISFGNSGGAAVDATGLLIGVPTQGRFDASGSLASLRPINLARPIIEAARRGERNAPIASVAANTSPILDVTFGSGLSADGAVTGAGHQFPSGTTYVVYSFRFQGLHDGAAWIDRWSRDGQPIADLSTPRPPWQAGPTGEFVTAIENPRGFSDGLYTVEIVFEGDVVARRTIAIGDEVELPAVRIARVIFATGVDAVGQPTGAAETLPSGATILYAFYDYAGAGAAEQLSAVWRREGDPAPIFELPPSPWAGGESGRAWLSLTNAGGIPAGRYEVEIRFDGVVAARATVPVEEGAGLPPALSLAPGESRSGSVAEGELILFRVVGVDAAEAAGRALLIELEGDGDADLYVRAGAPPALADFGRAWDEPRFQAPFVFGSRESVLISDPGADDWYIVVVGAGAAENVTVSLRLQ